MTLSDFLVCKAKSVLFRKNHDQVGQRVFDYNVHYKKTGKLRKALVCYISNVFLWKSDDPRFRGHVNRLRALAIVKILNEYGFVVDIIDCRDIGELPTYGYDLIIGHDPAFGVHAKKIANSCVKIYFATTQPEPMMRAKILKRYDEALEKTKKHFKIPPLPGVNSGSSIANWLFYLGDEYLLSHYREYGFDQNNSHLIHNGVGYKIYNCIERNYAKAKRNFIYFGSWGAIYRGLDRVLEAFAKIPHANLFVCGPLVHDTHFVMEYRKLLFYTKNIHTLGFVDVHSDVFKELALNVASLVYPSPSEAACSSVVVGMHAGFVPIVGKDASVIIPCSELLLTDYSINDILSKIKLVCNMNELEIKSHCERSLQYAKQYYSWDAIVDSFQTGIKRVMAKHF